MFLEQNRRTSKPREGIMSKLPIRFRQATSEDASFIFSSWLKSYRHSLFAKLITNTIYYEEHHKVIEALLKNCNVVIACNESDLSQIYGYAVSDKIDGILVIHYIYVKHSFRNMGLGKALLNSFEHDASAACIYTMHTRIADKLAARYNMVFHPYLLFTRYKQEETSKE
jgi:ribosomal protein S18 acetylase RimI-like enzyme